MEKKDMIFKKRMMVLILLALAIISFCLSGNGQAQSISVAVEGVTTTDLANNVKSAFNPEDPIRYAISYSAKRVALFFARGTVVFTGASEEKLKLQFQTVTQRRLQNLLGQHCSQKRPRPCYRNSPLLQFPGWIWFLFRLIHGGRKTASASGCLSRNLNLSCMSHRVKQRHRRCLS